MPDPKTPSVIQNRTLLIISLVLAAFAVLLVNLYVRGVESRLMRGSFYVLQATQDLKPRERIKEASVQSVVVPGRFQAAFEQAWKDNDKPSLIGRPVAVGIKRGEILFHSHLEAHRGAMPSETIRANYRTWGIRVDSRSVPASLQPGSVVDLAASVKLSGGAAGMPIIVMRGVKVIATGWMMSAPEDPNQPRRSEVSRVTIEVTPDEITKLLAVERNMEGEFRMADRNPSDVPLDQSDRFDAKLRPLFATLKIGPESEG